MGPKEVFFSYLVPERGSGKSFMEIECSEVPKPTDPSFLWLAEWKMPAPFTLISWANICRVVALSRARHCCLPLIQFFFGFASEWDIDIDQTNINRERRQLAVYPELWSSHMHCRANDSWTFKENIAQGTTDPRVEVISQFQTQILIKFHLQNLDLRINFSTKHQHLQ